MWQPDDTKLASKDSCILACIHVCHVSNGDVLKKLQGVMNAFGAAIDVFQIDLSISCSLKAASIKEVNINFWSSKEGAELQ